MSDVAVTTLARLFGTNGLYHTLTNVKVFKETDVATGTVTIRIAGTESKTLVGATGPSDVETLDGGIQMDETTADAVAAEIVRL
jgi:hypothetical protein